MEGTVSQSRPAQPPIALRTQDRSPSQAPNLFAAPRAGSGRRRPEPGSGVRLRRPAPVAGSGGRLRGPAPGAGSGGRLRHPAPASGSGIRLRRPAPASGSGGRWPAPASGSGGRWPAPVAGSGGRLEAGCVSRVGEARVVAAVRCARPLCQRGAWVALWRVRGGLWRWGWWGRGGGGGAMRPAALPPGSLGRAVAGARSGELPRGAVNYRAAPRLRRGPGR
jgi:hypothetical protein